MKRKLIITDQATQYCLNQRQSAKIMRHFSYGWPSVLEEPLVNLKAMLFLTI